MGNGLGLSLVLLGSVTQSSASANHQIANNTSIEIKLKIKP